MNHGGNIQNAGDERRREAKIVNKAVLALPPQNQGVEFKKKNQPHSVLHRT
jgi:hypothetical protein